MSANGSTKVIFAAMAGNTAIAVTKFAAAVYTGSTAMLAEAIHSLVDTTNQALLLFGMKRAALPADTRHPFGYGKELYFWSFIVAMLLFSLGAGFSIYEGVEKILHPHPIESPVVNYVVLFMAILFEGGSFLVALKEFNRSRGATGFMTSIRSSKDPVLFTVLFEDAAALTGLVIAILGIFIAHQSGIAWVDGATSVVIGLLLAGVAAFLSRETHGLLIGEAAKPELVAGVREIVENDERSKELGAIRTINEIQTLHFGPHDVLVTMSLDFKNTVSAAVVENAVARFEKAIKERFPEVRRLFIEVQRHSDHLANKAASGDGGEAEEGKGGEVAAGAGGHDA
ncbi:MAG: cation diffusion facilitator family transporter [Hyphomicrobiaceae bacterium]